MKLYDDTSADSILTYAKNLIDKTFEEIVNENVFDHPDSDKIFKNAKGQLGSLLEYYYFGYIPNSKQEADFPKAGVELKLTCIDTKKNGSYTAGERLSITNISYDEPVEKDFYKSHVWKKIRLILLVHYLRDKNIERLRNIIKYVNLFTPPKDDLKIIIDDYNKIISKIENGKAHELSESDTFYLGACTKGSTSEKSIRPQFYAENILAKKRNFCFKRQYMDYVLHQYILKDNVPYEKILKDDNVLSEKSFEEIILGMISKNIGKSDYELCNNYGREYNNNKAQWCDLAYRMLGIKSNRAEEFVKANIVVKAIQLEENGKIKENMSFPAFKFLDLMNQTWESSDLFTYFSETKFLFVVYKKIEDRYYLDSVKIWNMPISDLETTVREGWENIRNIIAKGVELKQNNNGTISNNLPGKNANAIIHIRPHADKAAYKLKDGTIIGNVEKDANQLPDGQWMTTQCFWINNSYIRKQLLDKTDQ